MGNRVDLDHETDNLDHLSSAANSFQESEDNSHIETDQTTTEQSNERIYEEDEEEYIEEIEGKSSIITSIKKSLIKIILLVAAPFAIIFLIIIAIILLIFSSSSIGQGEYYDIRCKTVTVIMTDKSNNYRRIGSKTYDFEDYVAGVVAAEVGGFNNIEVYKTIAIAARTYFLTHDGNKCIIESSDRKQVFRDITSQKNSNSLIYKAVTETAGQVLLKGKNLASVEYDAFCTIDVDANYYTLKQQNQKIPRSWADRQSGIAAEWKQGHCEGNHGRGISQWGAYYLASEQNYTFEQILGYYLGSQNISLSTKKEDLTSSNINNN